MSETGTAGRPDPYKSIKLGTGLGAYVTTTYGQRGRVFTVHFDCPESDWWKEQQGYDVAAEEAKTRRWVSVLVDGGGSAVLPETMVEPTEPFELRNSSAIFYFGEGTR
jgi:hypothetical protein